MKKNKLRLKQIFAVTIAFILLLSSFLLAKPTEALAVMPIRPDGGGDIVFKESEHIGVKKEVLNITVNNNKTADINVVYTMINTSNQSISAKTALLRLLKYSGNSDISVLKNGIPLDFTEEFYDSYERLPTSFDGLEVALEPEKSPSKPFGDGSGFKGYLIKGVEGGAYARFVPDSFYFCGASYRRMEEGEIEAYSGSHYIDGKEFFDDIIIVSAQDFVPETNSVWDKVEIPDIYQYLYQRAMDETDGGQTRFAEEQFNLYLFNIRQAHEQHFFHLSRRERYVGAITYFVDFAPYEELELSVSYNYEMGFAILGHSVDLSYLFIPAKYQKSFENIEINLTLSSTYKKLKNPSVKFKKMSDNSYKFISKSLPKSELKITVGDGKIFTLGTLLLVFVIAVIFVAVVIGLTVVFGFIYITFAAIVMLVTKIKERRK